MSFGHAAAHAGVVLGLLLALLPGRAFAASCEGGALPGEGRLSPEEGRLSPEERALLALVRELPLETRVGQLLMPGFVGTEPDPGLLERAARGRLGGLFLLGRNVRNEEQVQRLTGALSEAAAGAALGVRPFLATDFEGGIVNALRAVTGNTASAAQLAARGEAGVAAQGAADAEALRYLGFNTNLAPVADVLSTPSQVIGSRSFSADPRRASALSRAYVRGLRGAGVMGVMKHFPGHGATADDSHLMLPTVDRALADLDVIDLLPYRQAIQAGELDAVMVGHLFVPAIDPQLPSTLSPATILGLLRDRLGFGGVVMTDELKMRAISAQYGVERAALLAIQAGVDVILADYTGFEQDSVFNTLVRACRAGDLAPGRIDQSAARILRAKRAYGLVGPQMEARLGAHLAALSAPAAPATPAPEAEPLASDTSSEGTVGMTPGHDGQEGLAPTMPGEAGEPAGGQPAGDVAAIPAPSTPTPAAASVSTHPTPTPVSPQPTPTPLRTATATATVTATASPTATVTRTATRTATATRR